MCYIPLFYVANICTNSHHDVNKTLHDPFLKKEHMRDPKKHPIYHSNLFACRMSWKITQEKLAKDIGVSRATINAIEKEKRKPSLHLALKLADYFHTTVEHLFKFY